MVMNNVILIPFASNEGNLSLYLRALTWRHTLREDNQLNKIPDVVVYRRDDETDEDYDDYAAAQFKLTPENLPPNTNLYILSDGMEDNHFVTNINSFYKHDDQYYLPIELIALRLKELGLTPSLAKNLKSLKLFICGNEFDTTKMLVLNFANALGKDYEDLDLNLHYYTAIITIPLVDEFSKKVNKFWVEHKEENKETFSLKGKASNKKKVTTVREALQENPIDNDNDLVNYALSTNKALKKVQSTLKITELDDETNDNDPSQLTSSNPIIKEVEDEIESIDHNENNLSVDPEKKISKVEKETDGVLVEPIVTEQENNCREIVVRKNLAIIKFDDAVIKFNFFAEKPNQELQSDREPVRQEIITPTP